MKKLKRKIRRLITYINNSASKKYIIFVAITVPIFIFFIVSRFIFASTKSNSLNYNTKVTLTDYNIKISYATYNTDTHSFEFTWFMTAKNDTMASSSMPEIYSIAVDTDLDTFIEYDTLELSSTAKQIVAKNVPDDFEYMRIFFQSKEADTIVEDKYDEFGDLIEGYTITGETEYLEVHIDIQDVTVINNEAALTTTYVTFEELTEEDTITENRTSATTSMTATNSLTTTADATTTSIPTESVTTTTITTLQTTTTATPTTTTITAKPMTTTAEKTTTTTKATTTAEKTTTTTKQTTTTTTAAQYVALRGLKINSKSAVDGVITLQTGNTAQLVPIFTPENATHKAVKWTSIDTNIATIDSNGKVTAVSKGTTIIKCTTTDGEIFEVGIMIKVI